VRHKESVYTKISQFEPLVPIECGELNDLAVRLVETSAKLANRFPDATLEGIKALLQIVNSYYSNLIEGHNTRPIDIQRAMQEEYSADEAKRDLQIESLIHIDIQNKITRSLKEEPAHNVASSEFICWMHNEFYERLPRNLRWVFGDDNEKVWVEAGKIRERFVRVGHHIPPEASSLEAFMRRFEKFYDQNSKHGIWPIVASGAAHHRLMWIHPFLDGNGRVARLFSDAYFHRFGLAGYGLWNVSRGLARRGDDYRKYLELADRERENDLDGRGNLSNRTLTEFCRFFLEVCIDQAEFMNSMMTLNEFLERLEKYVELRNAGLIVDEKGKKFTPLHPRTWVILKETAVKGEIGRGEIFKLIEMSERSGRSVLKSLLDERLLIADSAWHKSKLRLGFPAHVAGYWFPNLFPNET
jgi:Fic family protein